MNAKVVLITGAAKRVGAEVAEFLHAQGWHVIIHYNNSQEDAEKLVSSLNEVRDDSALSLQADLNDMDAVKQLAGDATAKWGQIDALVNNASTFYPTKLAEATMDDWDKIFNSNVKAPFFLCQALADELKKNQGAIVNMLDIHVERPLKDYHLYSMSKAALKMLTKTLTKALAPNVRVNAVAPGIILWGANEDDFPEELKQRMLKRVPLRRKGEPHDIAETVSFLLNQNYITGEIIAVDGGRNLRV